MLNPHETKPEYHLLQEQTSASAHQRSSRDVCMLLRCLLRVVSWLERDRWPTENTRARPCHWSKPSALSCRCAQQCSYVTCVASAELSPAWCTPLVCRADPLRVTSARLRYQCDRTRRLLGRQVIGPSEEVINEIKDGKQVATAVESSMSVILNAPSQHIRDEWTQLFKSLIALDIERRERTRNSTAFANTCSQESADRDQLALQERLLVKKRLVVNVEGVRTVKACPANILCCFGLQEFEFTITSGIVVGPSLSLSTCCAKMRAGCARQCAAVSSVRIDGCANRLPCLALPCLALPAFGHGWSH